MLRTMLSESAKATLNLCSLCRQQGEDMDSGGNAEAPGGISPLQQYLCRGKRNWRGETVPAHGLGRSRCVILAARTLAATGLKRHGPLGSEWGGCATRPGRGREA